MTAVINYEGPIADVYDLVDELEEAGLAVEWVPPAEERVSAAEAVMVSMIARGAYDATLEVIRRVQGRLQNRATVSVDETQAAG